MPLDGCQVLLHFNIYIGAGRKKLTQMLRFTAWKPARCKHWGDILLLFIDILQEK